jgi:uncharacterized protein
MTIAEPSHDRSLIAKIFISPNEPRLRAGWRLLIHTIALIALVFLITIPVVIVAQVLVAAGVIDADVLAATESGEFKNPVMTMILSLASLIGIVLATWVARRFLDRRSFASLGLHSNKNALTDLLFGIGLGALLMGLIYAFESVMGWLTFEGWAWDFDPASAVISGLLLAMLLYLSVGIQEELMSRGYHLQNLWAGLNLPLALLISSGVFAALHLGNPDASWISTLGIFVAGAFLAFGYLRTRELWIPIGLHIGWNFFQGTIFGFPVSGTKEGFHLIHHMVEGPILITGAGFGPEAGLVSWAAMLLGAALIWAYTRNRTPAQRDTAAPSSTPAVDSSPMAQNS